MRILKRDVFEAEHVAVLHKDHGSSSGFCDGLPGFRYGGYAASDPVNVVIAVVKAYDGPVPAFSLDREIVLVAYIKRFFIYSVFDRDCHVCTLSA